MKFWLQSSSFSQKMLCQNNRITSNLVCICHVTTYIYPLTNCAAPRGFLLCTQTRPGSRILGRRQPRTIFLHPTPSAATAIAAATSTTAGQRPPRQILCRWPEPVRHWLVWILSVLLAGWRGGGGRLWRISSVLLQSAQPSWRQNHRDAGRSKAARSFFVGVFCLVLFCSCGLILCYNCLTPNSSLSL